MGVRDRQKQPDVALVVVIDKSGSMDACHCNSFDGGMGGGGRASAASRRSTSARRRSCGAAAPDGAGRVRRRGVRPVGALGRQDGSRWAAWRTCRARSAAIEPDGQTNIFAGLDQAVQSLKDANATRRHIILLTDGWSSSGQYDDILKQMKAAGITLSTVGAGGGANPFLEQLAPQGGGRFYAAEQPASIPDIFLKETQQVSGQQIVEEKFFPIQTSHVADPARASRAGFPQLLGYNGTTAKPAAQTVLVTARDDPLLAQWQYGLGRSVAWTSDSTGRWAKGWIGWHGFSTVLQPDGGLDVPGRGERRHRGGVRRPRRPDVRCASRASEADGSPRDFYSTHVALVGPGPRAGRRRPRRRSRPACTRRRSATLESGRVRGARDADKPGPSALGRTLGLVAPTAAEYRLLGANEPLLGAIRAATGGHGGRSCRPTRGSTTCAATSRYTDLWPLLLRPGAAAVAARHRAPARVGGPARARRRRDGGSSERRAAAAAWRPGRRPPRACSRRRGGRPPRDPRSCARPPGRRRQRRSRRLPRPRPALPGSTPAASAPAPRPAPSARGARPSRRPRAPLRRRRPRSLRPRSRRPRHRRPRRPRPPRRCGLDRHARAAPGGKAPHPGLIQSAGSARHRRPRHRDHRC